MTAMMMPAAMAGPTHVTEVHGTRGRLVQEIETLKDELQQLEQEEERIRKAKAAESDRKEHERRRKQQLEEEAKIRETIELRKYQEEQRKDRLRRMREEARQQEHNRQQKEKQYQQIQWELAAAKTPTEIENTLKKKKEIEEMHREKVKMQDAEVVATRVKLTSILDDMRRELQDLGQDDWMTKVNAKKAKQEKRLEQERALREQEQQAVGLPSPRVRRLQRERYVIRNEISTLRDELQMLERDEKMENMRRAARDQHLAESHAQYALSQDEMTRVTHERQAQQAEQEELQSVKQRQEDICLQEYILNKQLAQQRIGDEFAEQRRRETEELRALQEEARGLQEEQEAEAVAAIHRDLDLVATLQSQPVKESIRELMHQQQELQGEVPLGDFIKYSADVSSMHSKLAAEEIVESKKRLAVLRHEQAVQQERSAVLKLEAERARDRERQQAENHRIKSEEERKQRVIDQNYHQYEANMASARRERDQVREETQKHKERLRDLEAQDAEMQATQARAQQMDTEKELRIAEGRLLDQNAVKRYAECDTAALKRAARELEQEQELAERVRLAKEGARREQAARTLQGFCKIIAAKNRIRMMEGQRRLRNQESQVEGAAAVSQLAYRKKASLKAVELKRQEVQQRREAKAADLLRRIEEEEEEAKRLEVAVQQEVSREVCDGAAQTVPPRPATAERPKEEDPGDRLQDLEHKIGWLKQQLDDERDYHMQRENERRILSEQAADAQLDLLEEERELQERQIDDLTGLLAEHARLIQSLQDQLHAVTQYGPYEEDRERGEAAEKIQSAWRGRQVRKRIDLSSNRKKREQQQARVVKEEAVVVIQGMLRASAAKALRSQLHDEREVATKDNLRDEAATNIQRIVRGGIGRRKVADLEEALRKAETVQFLPPPEPSPTHADGP